ncbi:MAG: hypothetical protein EFT35_06075, partial [Methanophagales archaeon ANME-1-THS]
MMNKKLLAIVMIAALAAVLVTGFLIQRYSAGASRASEILTASKAAAENLESLQAEAYFFSSLETQSFTDQSKYWLHLDLLRTQDEGKKMKLTFEHFEYTSSDPDRYDAYERLRASLRDAWIIDTSGAFYVYSPLVLNEYVTTFTPQTSLLRYSYIPIADSLHLALLFDRAENATYEGRESVEVGGKIIDSHLVSYEFSYPTVRFAERAQLRTWISAEDYIPVKTELHATSADGAT